MAKPGTALQTALSLINSFIHSVTDPFPPTALRRGHAQTVRDSSSSYKIDYGIVTKTCLNPKGHQNPISGSQVTVILLKGWILPIAELHWEGSAINGDAPSSLLRKVNFMKVGGWCFEILRILYVTSESEIIMSAVTGVNMFTLHPVMGSHP